MSRNRLAKLKLARRPARERRTEDRRSTSARVLVWSRGKGHSTTMVEISKGGVRLQGDWEPCPTDPATLTLPGARAPLTLKARVLRVIPGEQRAQQPAMVALKFLP